ncbi:MAG: preprotein translocase subunit SecY [Verrucomicrobiae bacterium]|nr:preprotein translocase subunit SecY [Verrucomicrobiae bacterium]MCX7722125.1 preprotein translocase subunit SecY [Verrucomicrobiae bacterium]MDW7979390.1 preprotein translocase subunit SecY [Verrucomicrobiales bacterium]
MLASIIETFRNCFRIPELKSRILFTLMLLAICRLIAVVPAPGLDSVALQEYFRNMGARTGGLLGMYGLFTGGAYEHCAIGTLGIMPYISATIILQLLTAVIPALSKLAREEGGRVKLVQYGRYLTVLLCLGQGYFWAMLWEHAGEGQLFRGFQGNLVLYENLFWYRIQTAIVLTTGTVLLMWLGEQISERGIGNGVSLVITVGILARLPDAVVATKISFFPAGGAEATLNFGHAIILIVLLVGVVAGVIAVTQAQRKIPIQYAQRAVGRRVFAGGTSFLPLRVNYPGVMPIIFAQAILMVPGQIFQSLYSRFKLDVFRELTALFAEHGFFYLTVYALLIIFFSYFWVATVFNELQIADDLKKSGGYIPGVRPGQATSAYLHNAMHRITLAGGVFLTIIAIIPTLLYNLMKVPYDIGQFFGGTSLLITVGVLLDTMRQVESHLLMRHYDGFLKKGRIRGRF